MKVKIITMLVIPIGIFILMLPIVHGTFGVTSPYQLASPVLSVLFIPFYPLSMVLHIIGIGGIFDAGLLWLFSLPVESKESILPLWALLVYVGLSIRAIWSKKVFYSVFALATLYMIYLFMFI